VDVIVPLKSTMLSYTDAVQLAALQEAWQLHPSRDHQHIAFVQGVEHLWEACQVPLNVCDSLLEPQKGGVGPYRLGHHGSAYIPHPVSCDQPHFSDGILASKRP